VTADTLVATLLAGLFGGAVGSFLNVCILRLPERQSVVSPPSRCPKCGRGLPWYENIPIVSWLALRGRCAGCGLPISPMYPLVELTTALAFAAAYLIYGPTPLLIVRLVFVSAMIVLAMTDLRERILPNAITYPGIVIGLLCSLVFPPGIVSALLGAAFGAFGLYALGEIMTRVLGKDALGLGDVKMVAMIGAFLGWDLTLVTLAIASFAGSIIGLLMIAMTRNRDYMIPLGTFLAIGAVAAAAAGRPLLDWYLYSFSGLPR
jgi:leader peptidase (prepilin peptidase)/N-methyltransferase